MNTILNTDVYDADLYLRLSREDGDKEESDSIINQKELILEFLKSRKDIRIHAIRIDDGYSGVNFERPAFQEMLKEIKNGTVNCIITKDLSRFGRNHIEVGKYIEKIFPYLGVRFIAINDNYDSLSKDSQSNIIVPFKNLINDAYSRDISMKTRSSLEVKRKRGDFVGAFAPYGYCKSESDKNQLEIDEEAAEVVRYIFRLYLQGNNAYGIADLLNRENILTPMDYKREKGSAYYTGFKKEIKGRWNHCSVLRILGNPVYIGTLVQGKVTTPNYKVKKRTNKDQSRWNKVEKAHEAIISDIDFQNVQATLKLDTRTANDKKKVYCLSGVVRCGECGANMVRKTVPDGDKKFVYYVCGNHKANKTICSSHCINADLLEESVLKILNSQIENVADMEAVMEQVENLRRESGEAERRNRQLCRLREEMEKYCQLRLELYEDFKTELLTREEYLELKAIYAERIEGLKQALEKLKQDECQWNREQSGGEWMQEFQKFGRLGHLTREAVVSLIEKILIYEKQEEAACPRIEVCFKYAEEFQISLELIGNLKRQSSFKKKGAEVHGEEK